VNPLVFLFISPNNYSGWPDLNSHGWGFKAKKRRPSRRRFIAENCRFPGAFLSKPSRPLQSLNY
jgi:hypothetical protein